jgi:hypothetical protein
MKIKTLPESPTLCLPALYQHGSGPAEGRGGELQKKSALMRCTLFVSTPLEIMPRFSAAGLHFRTIPAGFNAPLGFLTGAT